MNLLTIPEIEKKYGISRFRIMKAMEAGEIPGQRIGQTWAFSIESVDRLDKQIKQDNQPVTSKDLLGLKRDMQKAGVSQADLARKLGVSPSYISHVLSGRSPISWKRYRNWSQIVTAT